MGVLIFFLLSVLRFGFAGEIYPGFDTTFETANAESYWTFAGGGAAESSLTHEIAPEGAAGTSSSFLIQGFQSSNGDTRNPFAVHVNFPHVIDGIYSISWYWKPSFGVQAFPLDVWGVTQFRQDDDIVLRVYMDSLQNGGNIAIECPMRTITPTNVITDTDYLQEWMHIQLDLDLDTKVIDLRLNSAQIFSMTNVGFDYITSMELYNRYFLLGGATEGVYWDEFTFFDPVHTFDWDTNVPQPYYQRASVGDELRFQYDINGGDVWLVDPGTLCDDVCSQDNTLIRDKTHGEDNNGKGAVYLIQQSDDEQILWFANSFGSTFENTECGANSLCNCMCSDNNMLLQVYVTEDSGAPTNPPLPDSSAPTEIPTNPPTDPPTEGPTDVVIPCEGDPFNWAALTTQTHIWMSLGRTICFQYPNGEGDVWLVDQTVYDECEFICDEQEIGGLNDGSGPGALYTFDSYGTFHFTSSIADETFYTTCGGFLGNDFGLCAGDDGVTKKLIVEVAPPCFGVPIDWGAVNFGNIAMNGYVNSSFCFQYPANGRDVYKLTAPGECTDLCGDGEQIGDTLAGVGDGAPYTFTEEQLGTTVYFSTSFTNPFVEQASGIFSCGGFNEYSTLCEESSQLLAVTVHSPTALPTDAPLDAPTHAPTEAPTDAPTSPPTDQPTQPPTQAPVDAPPCTAVLTDLTETLEITWDVDEVNGEITIELEISDPTRWVGFGFRQQFQAMANSDVVIFEPGIGFREYFTNLTHVDLQTFQDSVLDFGVSGTTSSVFRYTRPLVPQDGQTISLDGEVDIAFSFGPANQPDAPDPGVTAAQAGVYHAFRDKASLDFGLCTPLTWAPSEAPTQVPTDPPTDPPTDVPTDPPTDPPTDVPTDPPTDPPTASPTDVPTDAPTAVPTDAPTAAPTEYPTDAPTQPPSEPNPDACDIVITGSAGVDGFADVDGTYLQLEGSFNGRANYVREDGIYYFHYIDTYGGGWVINSGIDDVIPFNGGYTDRTTAMFGEELIGDWEIYDGSGYVRNGHYRTTHLDILCVGDTLAPTETPTEPQTNQPTEAPTEAPTDPIPYCDIFVQNINLQSGYADVSGSYIAIGYLNNRPRYRRDHPTTMYLYYTDDKLVGVSAWVFHITDLDQTWHYKGGYLVESHASAGILGVMTDWYLWDGKGSELTDYGQHTINIGCGLPPSNAPTEAPSYCDLLVSGMVGLANRAQVDGIYTPIPGSLDGNNRMTYRHHGNKFILQHIDVDIDNTGWVILTDPDDDINTYELPFTGGFHHQDEQYPQYLLPNTWWIYGGGTPSVPYSQETLNVDCYDGTAHPTEAPTDSPLCDLILVVQSSNSANSVNIDGLYEYSTEAGTTHLGKPHYAMTEREPNLFLYYNELRSLAGDLIDDGWIISTRKFYEHNPYPYKGAYTSNDGSYPYSGTPSNWSVYQGSGSNYALELVTFTCA